LGKDAQEAFLFGEVGLLTIDHNYEITWISELLYARSYQVIGQKIMNWLPETKPLFNNEADVVQATINDHIYQIRRKENGLTLYFKDTTELSIVSRASENKQIVLGLIHFDNYEETTQYEEEQRIALIDSKVLNEMLFNQMVEEQFSILKIIRAASSELDVAITLSMAFARNSLEFPELEEMVNGALALAQSRGGDQVAIKTYGEDVIYMGGNSEAVEKRSKVRARVMAQTLKELINQSSNVLILGHKEMDFDCFGAAVVLSRIVKSSGVPVSIVMHGALEEKLSMAYHDKRDLFLEQHHFVQEHETYSLINDKTLLVMVDHHLASQSTLPNLLEKVKKIAVIDHHRRNQDFTFNPLLVYMETAASSTTEMIAELIPYQQRTIEMTSDEANFALTGILLDTNRFRTRTGSRTFEVAALLKQYGADPIICDGYLKENFQDFILKAKMIQNLKRFDRGVVVASMPDDTIVSRAMISQAANRLIEVKEVEAAFVLSKISEKTVGVSARSNGNINVHVIMEKMSGGGHFTAAALQRENSSVEEVFSELEMVIEQWLAQEV
jgi:c-di-AMP phosphodiesterase-like protein